MELIVISNPTDFTGEARLINLQFEAGLSVFHLRKEGAGRLQYSRLIKQIDPVYHDRIALHQFHEIILDFNINRLHFPEKSRKQLLGKDFSNDLSNKVLSTSIHDPDELKNLEGFNYTFFGPVFNSISKPGYKGMTTRPVFTLAIKENTRVIALGGINKDNMEQVKVMGFDGMAVLGAIWNGPVNSIASFKAIQEQLKKLSC